MTRQEFARAVAYIALGCGKHLSEESAEVYFDLLKDLPADAFALAAKRVLLTHKYPTFPTIAQLREAATVTARGEVTGLSAGEAWALGWNAIKATDPEINGSFARATAGLPPLVVRALEALGVSELCYGTEPVTVVRAQFTKVYEQLAARESAAQLLPAATARAIAAKGQPAPRPLSLTTAPEGT